jgi:hypothetical protein
MKMTYPPIETYLWRGALHGITFASAASGEKIHNIDLIACP